MRFECGAKVEVMSKKDVLISWKSAEIVSGNGRTYIVMYDCYPGSTSEMAVERVPRKAVRPCPPHVEGVGSWVAGDVVEVLESFSWKIATISNVLDRDYYLVRLLGVPQEFRVHKSNTRVRQSWEESKWVVIGKVILLFSLPVYVSLCMCLCVCFLGFGVIIILFPPCIDCSFCM